jgi:pyruvate formate lyase activating enzyme
VRRNQGGVLYTAAYARLVAYQVDPVEKKPLYHFLPGTNSYSIAALGCNFRCGFCQNWEISQPSAAKDSFAVSGEEMAPREIVEQALKSGCKSISYTYTEPTVFFEYALETARLAKEKGLGNIFVTNGFMTAECLKMLRPWLDAANVDLKFFREESYQRICRGRLQPVLDAICLMKEMGVWVEITTLVVPGENDSAAELGNIAQFISCIDKGMPWHVSRFHPDYKFIVQPATPLETLRQAEKIGRSAGLQFVYVGNVSGFGSDTFCPQCKKAIIKRDGFAVLQYNMERGQCAFCRAHIPGVFGGTLAANRKGAPIEGHP